MSDKITIELTNEQLENIRLIMSLSCHKNFKLVKKSLPEEFQKAISYDLPEKIDVDYLIIKGSISDMNGSENNEFFKMFEKIAKKDPNVAEKYLEKMFAPPSKRNFTFSSNFRKRVAAIGLEHNILPYSGKMHYVKAYAFNESNFAWVENNLNAGNLPEEAWDILARSNKFSVCKYVIEKGPESILPVVVGSIPSVSTSRYDINTDRYDGLYHSPSRTYKTTQYLEYLFEHRIALIHKKIKKWKPDTTFIWMSKNIK